MVDEDKDEIAFTSHGETYRFNRMPITLLSSLATFQPAPDIILNKHILKSCLVYPDYIIILSKEHDQTPSGHRELVIDSIRRRRLTEAEKVSLVPNQYKIGWP